MGSKKKKVQSEGNRKEQHGLTKEMADKTADERDGLKNASYICIIIHCVLVLIVYIYTSYPSIPGGDSGELIVAAHELGVAHPPGYPLFTLLLWTAIKIIRFGNIAWRANMLNAVLSAAASAVFTVTIYKCTRSIGTSVIGSSLWTFSNLTWTWSTCVEVFCLNNLFVALLLYLMIKFEKAAPGQLAKVAHLGSFICGLALCNQHTIVVYVFVIALWVLFELHKLEELTFRVLCTVSACFLLGLVPYIYLPLSCILHNARWTWGNQADIHGFLRHLLRMEYGTFSLAAGGRTSSGILDGLSVCVQHILSDYTIVGAVMFAVGVTSVIRRGSKSLLVSLAMCVFYLVLFSWRANLDVNDKLFLGVVERFWMQSDMIVVLIMSIGVSSSFSYISSVMSTKKSWFIELTISCVICAAQIQRNFSACNQRDNTVIAEFGSRLFHNMPSNSLILTVGDLPSNTLRYIYLCENDRPDITVIDQELMTYKWFVPMLHDAYTSVIFPEPIMDKSSSVFDGQTALNFKAFLDVNYEKRPIISCIGIQNQDVYMQRGYYLFPYGPCSIVGKIGVSIDLDKLEAGALNISAGWKYPDDGYDDRSWEKVATNEMWNAKVNIGLKLYEMALEWDETSETYMKLMTKSYMFYKKAVENEKMKDIPGYWHRNFALACERMLRIPSNDSYDDKLKETILHFEEYMKKEPQDESVPIIEQSVKSLKQYIGKL